MQKTKPQPGIVQQYSLDAYLEKLTGRKLEADHPLRRACEKVWRAQDKDSELPSSLDVALILAELGVDEETLLVTLLSDSRLAGGDYLDQIAEEFGKDARQMVKNVRWIHDFHLDTEQASAPEQADRLRLGVYRGYRRKNAETNDAG